MRTKSTPRGLVIVAVLWIVVLLIMIVASMNFSSRLNMKVSSASVESVQRRWAGRAGVETAEAILSEDLSDSDSYLDLWSDNPDDMNDISMGRCAFTVKVFDEASKLNINTASKEQLVALPDMTDAIAEAIIDWRDNDDEVTGSGAESGYYNNLPYKYKIRNAPFSSVRELLMVKGVTEELLYGEDTNLNGRLDANERDGDKSAPMDNEDAKLDKGWIEYLTCYSYETNTDADGNERVNINQADENKLVESLGISQSQARWIVQNRPGGQYQSIADLISTSSPREAPDNADENPEQAVQLDMATFSAIADSITVNDEDRVSGKINVNTADEIVLTALFGNNERAAELAENIINYRNSQIYGMDSIADLLDVSNMNVDTFKRIAGNVTVRSNVYLIRSFVYPRRTGADTAVLQSEAIVDRGGSDTQILYWYEGENI